MGLAAINNEQLSLDIVASIRREAVEKVKVSFNGTIVLTRRQYEQLCEEALDPGRIVSLPITGFVPKPAAKWVQRSKGRGANKEVWHEQELHVGVTVTDIDGSIETGDLFKGEDE